MAEPERRRRRLRHGSTGGNGTAGAAARTADGRTAETSATYDPPPEQPGAVRRNAEPTAAAAEERDGERGLRSLVGSGSSQVSPGAALRARDAARPTEADLAEAERSLVIVRRNWVPREDLPRTGR